MTSEPAVATPASPEAGGITLNLPCARCGYNLRGLRADARCPECGGEVAASVVAWRERWLNVLSPAGRRTLFGGAAILAFAAVLAQAVVLPHGFREIWIALLVFMSWLGLMMITAVRWDGARTPWAGVPLGARIVGTIAVILACLQPWPSRVLPYDVRMIGVVVYTHLAVLATMLAYVHLARIANRFQWRAITVQALVVIVLMAVGVALELTAYPYARGRIWLVMGAGEWLGVRELGPAVVWCIVRSVQGSAPLLSRELVGYLPRLPLMLSTFWAGLLMIQLAVAAILRARPPKTHDADRD
jgi:hypothetical protein